MFQANLSDTVVNANILDGIVGWKNATKKSIFAPTYGSFLNP